jgi:DNA-directed RNA polymerase specialized sigma24 family protein
MKNQYVNNHDFLLALVARRKAVVEATVSGKPAPAISSYIGACIMKICDRLARSGKFRSYSYIDEMQSDAIEKMVAGIDVFDAKRIAPRSGKINPFAFFTQITWNAFLNRIDIEKKQNAIKFHNAVVNIPEFLISGENSEATSHVLEDYEKKQKLKKDKAKFKKAAVRVA